MTDKDMWTRRQRHDRAYDSEAVRAYFAALRQFAGWRVCGAIILGAVSAFLEGALLLLLLPLLAVAGLTGPSGINGLSMRLLRFAGISNNIGMADASLLIGLWIAGAIGVTILGAVRELESQATQEHFAFALRQRFQTAAMAADWMLLQRERAAEIAAAIGDALARAGEGAQALIQCASKLLGVAVQIGVAIAVAPRPCAVALVVGLVLLPLQIRRLRRAFRQGRQAARGGRNFQTIVSEHVSAMKLAKAHGAEAGLTAHFMRGLHNVLLLRQTMLRQRVLARMGFRITALLGLTVVVWISVTQFGTKGPALLVLVAVFARLVPAVGDILQCAHLLIESLAIWADTERLYVRLEAAAEPPAAVTAPCGSIVFEQVEMTWNGRDKPVLQGVNLTLEHRRTTAFVGPSGAGKTTLADLALGLITPSKGRIWVGGDALWGAARVAWRQGVAYVPQADILFNDTIRANLLWAQPQADEAALWSVLRLAALDNAVQALPLGLDSMLGDRGVFLSGGERQRLSLARALLREPAFIVLDEATSHLDGENERLIQQALERLHHRATMLIIAHRLETIRHADHIVVVEAGRIIEQGGWDELMSRPGGWLSQAAARQVMPHEAAPLAAEG